MTRRAGRTDNRSFNTEIAEYTENESVICYNNRSVRGALHDLRVEMSFVVSSFIERFAIGTRQLEQERADPLRCGAEERRAFLRSR
jgi:hypothetical protein